MRRTGSKQHKIYCVLHMVASCMERLTYKQMICLGSHGQIFCSHGFIFFDSIEEIELNGHS